MFGKAIGIDLGTANVLVYVKGRGVVLNEPSVVAYSEADNRVLAVGRQAREMLGRSPDRIQVVRPMRDGVIADYTITEAMLRYFIRRVSGRFSLFRPIVMICIPAWSVASSTARLSTLVTPAGMQIMTIGRNRLNRPETRRMK